MSSHSRIAKNTIVLLALRVGMPMLSVGVVLAVSRFLGTEGLGRYTLAFTMVYFACTLAPLGLYALIARDGARDRAALADLLGDAALIGGLSSLLLTAAMALGGDLLGYDPETRSALMILSLSILPSTLVTLFEGGFAALERMELIAIESVAENIVKVGGSLALLWTGHGLAAVMAAAVAGKVVACVVAIGLAHRVGLRVRWHLRPQRLGPLLRAAPTFLLISVFATLYWRIDVFMLSELRPVEDVGYYGAAYRLLEVAMVIPQSLCLALYPQMAQAAHSRSTDLTRLGTTALRYLTAVTLPIALCTTVMTGPLLVFLYGEAFRSAGYTLAVLIWTLVPYAWVRYHAYALVSSENQRVDLTLNAAMSLLNIVLNVFLIPAYGHLGAAMATLISICLYGGGQFVYFHRNLPGHLAPFTLQPVIPAACILAGGCAWILAGTNVVLALVVAPVLYFGMLFAGGFFTEPELKLLGLDRAFNYLRLSTGTE